jgi:hypothetical protein
MIAPAAIPEATREALQLMLDQLDSHKLEVQLVPLNPRLRGYCEGGMKRCVTDQPPAWYRRLCNAHVSSRGVRRGKFDTKLKRANILAILRRLVAGQGSISKYRAEIEAVARGVVVK